MNYTEMVVFIIYLLFMLSIGIWFFYKNRQGGEKTYFLGGRQMGPWVTALSAGASDMSAWVLMGLPTSIYALGLGQAWISIGLLTGYSLSWIFLAPRLRRFSRRGGCALRQGRSGRLLQRPYGGVRRRARGAPARGAAPAPRSRGLAGRPGGFGRFSAE